jgi:hypothetical protein
MAVKGKGIWRLLETKLCATFPRIFAGIAQLVEQLICNWPNEFLRSFS